MTYILVLTLLAGSVSQDYVVPGDAEELACVDAGQHFYTYGFMLNETTWEVSDYACFAGTKEGWGYRSD